MKKFAINWNRVVCRTVWAMPVALGAILTSTVSAVEIPPMLEDFLLEARNTRVGMYDSFESSVLGTTATPAETAATVRDWREVYSKPPRPLPDAERAALAKKYGHAKIFGAPRAYRPFPLGILGAWVTDANDLPELMVTAVEEDAPATGMLQEGDIIVGANGYVFPGWEDPRVPMGYAIAAAQTEAHGGQLTLHVGRDGKLVDAVISLPTGEPYDATNPYNCARSREIASAAVASVIEKGDDTMFEDLFLLGCGDEKAIALVRDRMRALEVSETIGNNWIPSYQLVSACEYYLLTGDQEVLPKIATLVRALEKNQFPTGGWGHGIPGGYGYMNQVGQVVLIGMALAKECGIEPDPVVLAKGVRQLTRFVGAGSAYGDHLPGISRYNGNTGADNGKLSSHATLFWLLGEHEAATRSARRACYQYRTRTAGHAERIFAIGWGSLGPWLAPEAEYTMYANNMIWYYELARQRDGSLRDPSHTRYGRNTAAVGMTFALAERRLRITGKAKGTAPLFPVGTLPEAPGPASPPVDSAATEPVTAALPKMWDIMDVTLSATPSASTEATFIIENNPDAYTHCAVTLPTEQKGELWLNGHCVAIFPEAGRKQESQTLLLGARAVSLLKEGENRWELRSASPVDAATMKIALAPAAQRHGKAYKPREPDYGNFRMNGWSGSQRQHLEGLEWFFEGKSPEEIARYLAYPDGAGAYVAYKALARGGEEALALCKKLVRDTHAGIRVGAWDAIAEMHNTAPFTAETRKELAAIAATQVKQEEGYVGMALCRAAAPLAQGEDLFNILAGVATMDDALARAEASKFISGQFNGTPEQEIKLLTPMIAAKLDGNDIRTLGRMLHQVSDHAQNKAAVEALPAIAAVLDEVAPNTRGMFSDGLMHGGLLAVEHQLSATTERTPQLVSGLIKCFYTVPDGDWPGWAYANLFLRRLVYRLTEISADEIDAFAEAMLKQLPALATEPDSDEREPLWLRVNRARATELKLWADLLLRTGGNEEQLKKAVLFMAESLKPGYRTVALSLVWPSQRGMKLHEWKNCKPTGVPDNARINDSSTALKVAFAAAKSPEANSAIDWYMIWLTINKHGGDLRKDAIVPLVADYLNHVWRLEKLGFHHDAIDQALLLVKDQITSSLKNAPLAEGLAKTYLTFPTAKKNQPTAEMKSLLAFLKKMEPESRNEGITKAIKDVNQWLKTASNEEKKSVVGGSNLKSQITELKALVENQ